MRLFGARLLAVYSAEKRMQATVLGVSGGSGGAVVVVMGWRGVSLFGARMQVVFSVKTRLPNSS